MLNVRHDNSFILRTLQNTLFVEKGHFANSSTFTRQSAVNCLCLSIPFYSICYAHCSTGSSLHHLTKLIAVEIYLLTNNNVNNSNTFNCAPVKWWEMIAWKVNTKSFDKQAARHCNMRKFLNEQIVSHLSFKSICFAAAGVCLQQHLIAN